MKTKKTPPVSTPVPMPDPMYSHSQIADRAYEIWLNEGRPANRDVHHWFEAERQLREGKGLQDAAHRLTGDPLDPALDDAARTGAEIQNLFEQPPHRSATSLR